MPAKSIVRGWRKWCACVAVSAAPLAAVAQEPAPEASIPELNDNPQRLTIAVYVENDTPRVNPLNDTDRWYTSGVGMSVSWPLQPTTKVTWLPGDGAFERRALGVMVAQQIFTPENILTRTPDPTDRPYAGHLFAGLFYQRANATTLDHLQVNLGVTGGPSLGEEAQDFVHELTDADEAQGWGSQLLDEPTFQLYGRRKWRMTHDLGGAWALQGLPHVGAALGTAERNVDATIVGRLGFRLPDDFGPGRLADPTTAATADPQAQVKGFNFYVFTRATGRLVEHDMFVEGSQLRSGPGVDEETLVGEFQFGLSLGYRRNLWEAEIIWSQTYVTPEFENQHDVQGYGAINARLALAF